MKITINLSCDPAGLQMDDCQIEKVVELSHEDFERLKITPLADQPFIIENKGCMFSRDGVRHCLLALEADGNDGILVGSDGPNDARLTSYLPGARHIVNAEMGSGQERRTPDIRVKDLLPLLQGGMIFLCHEDAAQAVLAEHLHRMSETGREDHTALLNARVSEICDIPTGTEVVLADVDPEELVRFNEAYDAFIEAEEAMGQGMMQL